ncbi:DNA primase [Candidatus Bipolaricaulota bacterium]|nr:DNA primase [Candidatus Bipolaricaulota bacterium]
MDRQDIDKVRKKVDIVELVSRYVNLKKSGNNYKGVCPFHEDNDPSLTVDPTKKLWHCFGCGAGGDVFNFLMKIENLSFPDAVRELAAENGVKLPDKSGDSRKTNLTELMNEVNKYYHSNLLREGLGKKGRNYLKERGYGEDTIKEFSLGYALDSWNSLTNKFKGKYGLNSLKKVGLIKESEDGRHYDRFRNRLIFPIRSVRGKVVAFGGRILDSDEDSPKYLNSPNTPLFQKGETFYGLSAARRALGKTDQAILVEGYTDVIAPSSRGIKNVIASMGTSLTEKQVDLLSRYVSEVLIAYDRDQAGEQATLKGLKLLRNKGLGVKVAKIPEGDDPADIIENQGAEKLKEIFNEAQPFHEFYLDLLKSEYDLSTVDGREKALKSSTRFLSEVKSPPLRHELIDRLKDMLSISASEITQRIKLKGSSASPGQGLKVDRTQEGLSLDEWVVHLLIEGKLSRERLEEEGILEELDPKLQPLAEKIVEGRGSGAGLEEIMQDMGEKEREELSRISLVEVKFEEKDTQKASEEVIKKFIKQKRLPKLQEQRRKAIEEGDEERIQKLQEKIVAQQEKLREYR